jgi:hypothetical protein
MFSAAKDALTSKAAKSYVNQRIARYGEVRMLRLDSSKKTVEVVCQLIGERDPVTIRVNKYELIDSAGSKVLRIGECTCSRPWLQNLLNDFGCGREVPLPGWAASAL